MTVIRENQGDGGPTSIQSTYRAFDGRGQSHEYTTRRNNAAERSSKVSPRAEVEFLSPSVQHVDTNRLSTIQNEAGDSGLVLRQPASGGSRALRAPVQPRQLLGPAQDLKGSFYQPNGKKFNEDLNISSKDIAPRRAGETLAAAQPRGPTPPARELELGERCSTLPFRPAPSQQGQRPGDQDRGRPDVEVLKSYTPSQQSPASHMRGVVVYDKVQQPAAQI